MTCSAVSLLGVKVLCNLCCHSKVQFLNHIRTAHHQARIRDALFRVTCATFVSMPKMNTFRTTTRFFHFGQTSLQDRYWDFTVRLMQSKFAAVSTF